MELTEQFNIIADTDLEKIFEIRDDGFSQLEHDLRRLIRMLQQVGKIAESMRKIPEFWVESFHEFELDLYSIIQNIQSYHFEDDSEANRKKRIDIIKDAEDKMAKYTDYSNPNCIKFLTMYNTFLNYHTSIDSYIERITRSDELVEGGLKDIDSKVVNIESVQSKLESTQSEFVSTQEKFTDLYNSLIQRGQETVAESFAEVFDKEARKHGRNSVWWLAISFGAIVAFCAFVFMKIKYSQK